MSAPYGRCAAFRERYTTVGSRGGGNEQNIDLTCEVPRDVTEVTVPGELFLSGAAYQFELMVVDAGGNQTFTVGSLATGG